MKRGLTLLHRTLNYGASGKWAHFTPSLTKPDSNATGLDGGYLDFHTATPAPKTLGSGMGFWVRR